MLWSWSVLLSNLGSLSLLHMFISVLVCQRLIINRNVIAKYWETYLERLPTVNLFLALFFYRLFFWQLVCSTVSCWQSVTFCSRDSCESPGNWSQRWNCFRSGFFTVCSDFATNAQLLLSISTQLPKKRSLLKKNQSEMKTAKEMKVIFVLSKKSLIHAVTRLEYSPLWPFSISISIWWWWWWMKTESSDWCSHTCFPLSNFLPISQLYWC